MPDLYKDWVETNAVRHPDSPALVNLDTEEHFSWLDLERRVGALASVLVDRFHTARGDRVLIIAEGDVRTFEIQFACLRIGAIMSSLNWRLTLSDLVGLGKDLEPSLIIFDEVWRESAVEVARQTNCRQLLGWRSVDDYPDYDDLVSQADHLAARNDLPMDIPAMILHTSGTTGRPKGAIITAKALAWQTLNVMTHTLLHGPGTKQLQAMPLFHAGALNTISNPMLLTGGAVAVSRRFDPDESVRLLGDPSNGYTHFTAPPTMWQMMAGAPGLADADFGSLQFAQVAGGMPSLQLMETWEAKGVTLQPAYGGTELGPNVTCMPRDMGKDRPTSCGKAVQHTHIRLVSSDGKDTADGEVGEVWLHGPSVISEYWRHESADNFDGWFRTGDAATRDAEGYYYIVDRFSQMYKTGGENVAPAEVERVIATHDAVLDVAIVGVPDAKWGETGHAFVTLAEGSSLSLEELRAHCEGKLARYKHPTALFVLDDLPRNVTGKVQKQELRKLSV